MLQRPHSSLRTRSMLRLAQPTAHAARATQRIARDDGTIAIGAGEAARVCQAEAAVRRTQGEVDLATARVAKARHAVAIAQGLVARGQLPGKCDAEIVRRLFHEQASSQTAPTSSGAGTEA